ncbi:MAG: hypothetical protein D3907_00590 [Candidatus Electrothrix sp. AUS3]|nr:hypothetical protein [Candidatus Electrothrix gigas]
MKKSLKLFFAIFLIVNSSSVQAASLSTACEMFLHSKFKGNKYLVYSGAQIAYVGTAWNDQVSSVKVPAGCQLKVYLHSQFKGFDKIYPAGPYSYVGDSWNDQISSVKCVCN